MKKKNHGYITVINGIPGYYCVWMMSMSKDHPESWKYGTGLVRYRTSANYHRGDEGEQAAINEGLIWAKSLGIKFMYKESVS